MIAEGCVDEDFQQTRKYRTTGKYSWVCGFSNVSQRIIIQ